MVWHIHFRKISVLLLLVLALASGWGGMAASQVSIGGPFSLTGGDGSRVNDREFRGQYLLVFFGYTNCPDLCPAAMNNIAGALAVLKRDAVPVRAVFITIDPVRDTAGSVAAYARLFSPEILGLTGTPAQIQMVEREFHVFVSRPAPQSAEISHSALIYLMGKDGKFITAFPDSVSGAALAGAVRKVAGAG